MMGERCEAAVYKRDTYRYTGRTKSGFEMHYNRCRCSRMATINGFCRQHAAVAGYVETWEKASPWGAPLPSDKEEDNG
jgi:hypothetical protein